MASLCYSSRRKAQPVTDDNDYALQRQLAVVDVVTPISHSISNSDSSAITPLSSPFSLPDGWFVHPVPRSDGLRVDKYYIESETGRKFRSRREVKRYLNVEEYKATRSRPLRLAYRIKNTLDLKMITSQANYYNDPNTERKFRSLKDVERNLTKGSTSTKSTTKRLKYHEKHLQSCSSRKKIVSRGKRLDFEEDKYNQYQLVNVTPTSFQSSSTFTLPDGWIVEEVPRKTGDHIDRYYYEPGTGQKFRSLTAVQKHIAELEENAPLSVVLEELRENNLPIAKAFKLSNSIKNHGSYDSWKKSVLKKDEGSSSFTTSPPSKINWVIASSGGQNWDAFIGDNPIPDSLKQEWNERFLLAIGNGNQNESVSA
ncbi:unnamed protein product [Lactuca virosa]|uniref:MBD domain-containing protein n=1 Tax=Lactuca virosa TaxID=75947 RepID=A0AAU9N1T8_9ASTR|nr:unnamed protein product [Lactuca virosa]